MLCRRKKDNRGTFTCPFHGWTFSNNGKLLKVKDPRGAGYPEQFNNDGSHDLTKVARFESYRGFLFGSLNPDVVAAGRAPRWRGQDHRHDRGPVAGGPGGAAVAPPPTPTTATGRCRPRTAPTATTSSAAHWNYAATTSPAHHGESATETKAMDAGQWDKQGGGYYSFENGHLLLWTEWGNPEDRPLGNRRDEWATGVRTGPRRLDARFSRNLCLYPNVYLMDQFSLADPALPADRRGQDRGHHLLHRPEGRERRGAHRPHPPVRGLLQRHRHGHPGRPGGVPLLPEDLPGRRPRSGTT